MDDFDCPISKERMKDPVITPNGDTYDRVNIEEWIRSKGTDPCTRAPLAVHELIPNRALKNIIETLFPPEVVHTPASSSSAAAASNSNPQPMQRTGPEPRQVWVMRADFDGRQYGPEYLVLREGDELQLLPQMEDGWSMGKVLRRNLHHTEGTGSMEEGWFPSDYVQLKEASSSAAAAAARERVPSPSPAASQAQLDRAWQRARDRARALPNPGSHISLAALNLDPSRLTAAGNNRAAIPRDGNNQAPGSSSAAAAAARERMPGPAPTSQDAVAGAAMQMPMMQMQMAAPPSTFSAPSAGPMYYMYVPSQPTEGPYVQGDGLNMGVPVIDAGGMAGVAMQMPMMQMQTVPAMQTGGEMMMLVGAAAAAEVPAAAPAPAPLVAAAATSPSPAPVTPTPKRKGIRNVSIGRKPAAKPAAVWLGDQELSSSSAAAAAAPARSSASQATAQERSPALPTINSHEQALPAVAPLQQPQFMTHMTPTMPQQQPVMQMMQPLAPAALQAPMQYPATGQMQAPMQFVQMPEMAEQHGVEPPAPAPAAPKKKGIRNLALTKAS